MNLNSYSKNDNSNGNSSDPRRQKIENLKKREDKKGDRRQVLEHVLTSKLIKKYGKNEQVIQKIKSLVSKLVKGTSRITESDIASLELSVKQMSLNGLSFSSQAKVKKSDSINDSIINCDEYKSDKKSTDNSKIPVLEGSNEWVVINTLQSVEHERNENLKKNKIKKEREQQRLWLDAQQKEKNDKLKKIKESKTIEYKQQMNDLKKWKIEEEEKEKKRLAQIEQIKLVRQRQLEVLKKKKDEELRKKRLEEEREVERCKRILCEEEEEREQNRLNERERMRKVLLENQAVEIRKQAQKEKETEYDIKLMEEYAKKLAKEEQDRIDALASKLRRQDEIHSGIAMSTHELIRKKAEEDYRKAEEYQRKKIAADDEREKNDIRKRKEEAMKCKEFLDFQKKYKEEQKLKLIKEEQIFANQYQKEGEDAKREAALAIERIKEKNKKNEIELCRQIQMQKEARAKKFAAMNQEERKLNAKIFEKLEKDETLVSQIQQKLSPEKQHAQLKSKTMKSSIF